MKKPVLIRLLIDSREQDITWIDKFNFDKKFSTDKIKIDRHIICTPFKCVDINGKKLKTSTGDVGYQYSFDDGETWNDTNLSIELKRNGDFSSTLYSSYKRFTAELDRALEAQLDFYIVYNQSTLAMKEMFGKLKTMQKIPFYTQPEKIVYDRMLEVSDKGIPLLFTHEIHEVIKRIVKHHIKKHKIQYK